MNNTPYVETAKVMHRDINDLEAHLKLLRSALKAITPLTETATPGASPGVAQLEVPEEWRDLTHGERLLSVMNREPANEWKTGQLASLAYIKTTESARTALKRLAADGKVTINDSLHWVLLPAGTTTTS